MRKIKPLNEKVVEVPINQVIPTEQSEVLDMVIAFDTTGSMSAYIAQVRKYVKDLIPSLFNTNPNLRLSIVAFGDYCDMSSPNKFGNAYQCIDLTNDHKKLIKFVENSKDTNGGDSDEFYELVLRKIRLESDWREDAKKAILLIADACPHKVGYSFLPILQGNTIDWEEEAKQLKTLGIQVDTVTVGNMTGAKEFYQKLSKITNGVNSPFQSSSKTSDLITVATLSRSGNIDEFYCCFKRAVASDDDEIKAVYKRYHDEMIKPQSSPESEE